MIFEKPESALGPIADFELPGRNFCSRCRTAFDYEASMMATNGLL